MSRKLLSLTLPLCFALAAPVAGATMQERLAWVLATTGENGTARADAAAMSRRLMAAGFSVTRRENATPAALDLTAQVAPVVVLYFSGPVARIGDETWLLSAPLAEGALPQGWPLNETVRQLRAAGAQQVVAMVEGCAQPGAGFAPLPARADAAVDATTGVQIDAPPAETAYPEDVVFILSTPAGEDCAALTGPSLTDRLTKALSQPGADFLEAFAQAEGAGWIEARLAHQLAPLVPAIPSQLGGTGSAEEMLRSMPPEEAARLRPLWEASGLLVGAAQAATPADSSMVIEAAGRITPGTGSAPTLATPVATSAVATAATGDGFSLISVSAGARIAARGPAAGLPQPSIIVGEIGLAEDLPAPETAPEGLIDTTATLRNLPRAERVALRKQDAAGFDVLVDSGVFDPPPAELVRALQTELQAAGCYRGGIDGSWGNGSITAVASFFRERGTDSPGSSPSNVLYRALLSGEEVACPVPVAAPAAATAARPNGGGNGGNRSATTQPAGNRGSGTATAATREQPRDTGKPQINLNSVGLNVRGF